MSARKNSMVISSLVADAATMGLHWIYNQDEIRELVKSNSVAFHTPPACPFYTYETGSLSPYGDEIIPFLESIGKEGRLNPDAAASASYDCFKAYSGRLNHVCSQFMKSRDEGKSWTDCACVDHQAQGIIKMPLIVARYAGSEELLERVTDAVNVIQRSDISISSSKLLAIILQRLLLSEDSPAAAIRWAGEEQQLASMDDTMRQLILFLLNDSLLSSWVQYTLMLNQLPVDESQPYRKMRLQAKVFTQLLVTGSVEEALVSCESMEADDLAFLRSALQYIDNTPVREYSVQETLSAIGLSCLLPSSLLGALYIALRTTSFVEAVTVNILCGGDNCSRAIVLGGLFGATSSLYIPAEWLDSVKPALLESIHDLSDKITI